MGQAGTGTATVCPFMNGVSDAEGDAQTFDTMAAHKNPSLAPIPSPTLVDSYIRATRDTADHSEKFSSIYCSANCFKLFTRVQQVLILAVL